MSFEILEHQFKARYGICFIVFALWGMAVWAQDITVSGTVSDANGPLPGASVIIQGTSNGTTTDFDGNFTLNNVASDAVLEISYIGYRKEQVAVNGRTTINITLEEDLAQLDEVVVVGYGTQSRRVVTGAIESIDSEAMSSVPVTTSEQALQGRASGVSVINSGSPGQPPVVRIRGLGTMNNNDPLYVIDGVIGGRLADVDPQDIQSIEVLKDASTTAIYGSKGSNGVVMITTKKGRKGKVSLTLDSYVGTQFVNERLDIMNTAQYIEYAEAFGLPDRVTDPQYADMLNNDTDWQDAIFQSGLMHKHNFSVSGGGDNSDFRISGGFIDQDGILRNTGFKRHNFRANSNFTIGRLKVGETVQIVFNNQNPETEGGGRSVIRHAIRMAPYLPIYNPDNPGGYQGPNSPIDGQDAENPVRVLELGERSNRSVNIIGGLYAEFEILDGLVFKTQAGLDYRTFNNNSFVPSFNDDNLGATHTQDHAAITKNSGTFKSLVYTNSLNYRTTFNEKHHLEVLLLAEKQTSKTTNTNTSSRNYISNDVNEISNTDSDISSETFEYTRVGYLGRINYDFNEKYILAASIRRDGSSRFGPNNRWGNFYSLAGGWRISEESFFNVPAVDNLKLRGSWGTTGNDNIDDYAYSTTISQDFIYPIAGEGAVGATPSGLANPNVKWEETTMTNIGLDLGLLNNTVTLSAEYYRNKSDDLLMDRPIPPSLGTHSGVITENVGSVETSGFEFNLGYNDYDGDFTWSANLNLGTNTNEALDLGGVDDIQGADFIAGINDNLTRVAPGESLFHFYGFETDGVFQNQAEVDAHATQADAEPGDIRMIDQNGDGVIDDNDRVKIGDPFPDLTFGLNVNAAYKNFDFNLFVSGATGQDVFNTLLVDTEGMLRLFNAGTQVLDRWTGEGTSNSIPRAAGATLNTRASDRYVEDGSYARLRNITLGYTLPREVLGGYFSKFRIYLSGQNLVTLTGYSGYDPEVGAYTVVNPTSNFEVGIDRGNYPQPKSLFLGLQVSF
ncbi:TonB-dependent receptor [Sinomicrobium kalidii]|uniref:SusC/RagA family TonB-linked outer membrane protein n=1 Tax=Sinomicrobium kalidii TaxID=2900738 RepID=UPI001E428B96|nr:TonB-dependent receptor [Sinomicrobium kalidii]UGU14507.1 TonB-dependent receptor [Sinomicrobium kalidii]